jgi:hypothetical protein
LIALYSPVLEANSTVEPYAQVHPKVKTTLAKDSASLGVFRYLGKLHCVARLTHSSSDSLTIEYGSLYNHLYPLPRLITQEALTRSFEAIESRLADLDLHKGKSKTHFIDPVSVCHKLYEERRASHRQFAKLVLNDASYHQEAEVDIEQYSQDYLIHYFITQPSTK